MRQHILVSIVTFVVVASPAQSQEPVVGIQFTNPGYATMNVFRVNELGRWEEHWGAVEGSTTSVRIPSKPGELWRFRLAASALSSTEVVRFEYRATSALLQNVELPGFLENAKDPGADYGRQMVAQLGKTVETVLNAMAFSSPMLVCPNGENLPRPRAWNTQHWRAEPRFTIEQDIRSACSAPSGLRQSTREWWYGKASENSNACSGPTGEHLSRWGRHYEFLQDACVIHDLCYTSSMTKDQCDRNFVLNMQALCKAPGFTDWAVYPYCALTEDFISRNFWFPAFQEAYDKDQRILRDSMPDLRAPSGVRVTP